MDRRSRRTQNTEYSPPRRVHKTFSESGFRSHPSECGPTLFSLSPSHICRPHTCRRVEGPRPSKPRDYTAFSRFSPSRPVALRKKIWKKESQTGGIRRQRSLQRSSGTRAAFSSVIPQLLHYLSFTFSPEVSSTTNFF